MIVANIFQPLIDLFEQVLVFIHDTGSLGWGVSIIVLTVLIRALMIPLAVKQMRSMREMQRHAPELKKIQQKFKDDPQRRNQETMKFYQENQVNPFASCLPMLAQMPVFLSLFYMLRKDLRHDICPEINPAHAPNPKPCGADFADAHFLFIHDITDKATGGVLITLILLYVGSQLLSSLLMMTPNVDKTQRMIMLGLPVFFVPFILAFPAGLLVYWITTNVWTIVQQQVLKRVVGHGEPLPVEPGGGGFLPDEDEAVAGTRDDKKKKSGGLFGKLTEMAVEQQERQKQAGGSSNGRADTTRVTKPPPPPPRSKKRKRSGRRK